MGIIVLSGNTEVGRYKSIDDLGERFKPWDGRWQNYWYRDAQVVRWIPWREIVLSLRLRGHIR